MKKRILVLFSLVLSLSLHARVVKFSVDMAGQEVSPNGVHVTGDFQELAGFPGGDWSPNTTPMAREGQSTVYSTIVNIPAFRYYEYRFVNGDQFYETEFVPVESRIGYEFNDNRWIYVDSLANDTLDVGAILFGGNAPEGKFLLRFNLNAQLLGNVHPAGIRVAGSFNGWNPALMRLVTFDGQHWEGIVHLPAGNYEYRFANGNTASALENVPASCASGGNRQVSLSDHTPLDVVCYGACVDCNAVGMAETTLATWFSIKRINGGIEVLLANEDDYQIALFDTSGRMVLNRKGRGSGCAIQIPNANGIAVMCISSGKHYAATKISLQ